MSTHRVRAEGGRRATARWVALALAVALPLAGCGTRQSEEAISRADGSGGAVVAAAGQGIDGAAGGAVPGAVAAPGGPVSPGAPGGGGADAALAADPGAPGAGDGAGPAPVTAGAGSAPGTPGGGNAAESGGSGGRPADGEGRGGGGGPAAGAAQVATGANAPCEKSLEPVILGQTAPISGIIGAATANLRSGLALWARAVNEAGGVQCHPVQVFQLDDGADPARVTSNLTELVESRKAVAIVGIGIPTTFPAAAQFAERSGIPFIGGDLIEPAWYSNPLIFPQGGSALAAFGGGLNEAAETVDAKKAGLIYCVEASICGTINENFEAMAEQSGLEVVLRKVSSITSTDYTAECQALKSAGAEVVFFSLEGSGDGRASRSCRSLDYNPPIATAALAVSEQAANDPNLQAQGVYLGTGNAPFTATDTPGGKAFTDAYNTYAKGSSVDQNSMAAWASGKLFEAAMANVFEKARSGPITTELILEGLWKVKNEKLDGLAPGITFNKNALPTQNDCYYSLTITTKGYGSPKGSKSTCFKGLPKGY